MVEKDKIDTPRAQTSALSEMMQSLKTFFSIIMQVIAYFCLIYEMVSLEKYIKIKKKYKTSAIK